MENLVKSCWVLKSGIRYIIDDMLCTYHASDAAKFETKEAAVLFFNSLRNAKFLTDYKPTAVDVTPGLDEFNTSQENLGLALKMLSVAMDALAFYGDQNKYFTSPGRANRSNVPHGKSDIVETHSCSMLLALDKGKTANDALAEIKASGVWQK